MYIIKCVLYINANDHVKPKPFPGRLQLESSNQSYG